MAVQAAARAVDTTAVTMALAAVMAGEIMVQATTVQVPVTMVLAAVAYATMPKAAAVVMDQAVATTVTMESWFLAAAVQAAAQVTMVATTVATVLMDMVPAAAPAAVITVQAPAATAPIAQPIVSATAAAFTQPAFAAHVLRLP